jgi:D-lactate dehydrogenase
MKIAFFDTKPYDMPGFDRYSAGTGLEIKYFETKLTEDTVSLAAGFDGVCVFVNDLVNEAVVNRLQELGVKVLVLRCAGYNNVDLKAAKGKLKVFRVPAYSPYAVAEHAMALLLTVNRRTHKAYIRTKEFNFSLAGLSGFDLHGKTVGIIGTGKIGRVFADICKGFGMEILAYDKYPSPETGLRYVSLEELFARSDIISLHCPLTEETHHLINRESIAGMKPGVVIVNTSRGGLVDTDALIAGIKSKQVGAACLDVYEEEGEVFYEDFSGHILRDDKLVRLIAMPNVIVTSHQAFLTEEALDNIAQTTVENLLNFSQGIPSPETEVI